MSGLSPTGFDPKTFDEILDEIKSTQLANIDPSLDLSDDSVLGSLDAIVAEKISEQWELALAVYKAFDPDQASGQSLDAVAALTGVSRLPADVSRVTITCSGTPATVLPVGRVVSVVGAGDRFVSTEEKTIEGGGSVDVPFESEETGPIVANAGTLTEIETPVSGWTSATNALDAVLGRDIETDAALRIRREILLRATGAGSVEAIRARVLEVEDVTAVFVFENVTDVTDGDGVPPKAFETLVTGGDEQDIADEIWLVKPAGIESHGSISKTVVDSQGDNHTIKFSRPSEIDIYLEIDITVDPGTWPGDGVDRVKAAYVAYGDGLGIGTDIIYSSLFCPAFEIPGVLDITDLKVDTVTPPVGTSNIPISKREVSAWDTSRITVNVTP